MNQKFKFLNKLFTLKIAYIKSLKAMYSNPLIHCGRQGILLDRECEIGERIIYSLYLDGKL